MPTTAAAIRDAIVSLIKAIVPASHSGQRFVGHREEMPFPQWVAAQPASCLRRYSVRFTGSTEPPRVNDTLVQEVSDVLEILVAYPISWRHGNQQLLDLDDVIELDATKIERTVGPPGYATLAGLIAPATILWEQPNERQTVTGAAGTDVAQLLTLRYRVDYFRSLS